MRNAEEITDDEDVGSRPDKSGQSIFGLRSYITSTLLGTSTSLLHIRASITPPMPRIER